MASKLNLYIASTLATLTSSLFGYTVGLIGGLIVLPSFLDHFGLSSLPQADLAAAQARIVTIWLVGAFFGVPIGIPICAKWGRRMCLALSAGFYVLGAGLQLAGHSLIMFEAGRAINGLGVGLGTMVGPIYISEVSTPADRGMLMSGYQTLLQLSALVGFWGAFASNAIFSDTSNLQWQLPVVIQLIPGSLLFLGSLWMPETPHFLASRDDWKATAESLAWLRQLPQNDSELMEELRQIRLTTEANQIVQDKQPTSFLSEVIKRPIRKRLGVGIGLMVAQNMIGLNALNYYAPVIFMSAGFKSVSSSLFLTGIFGLVKLISATAFMFIFVRVKGNRFWLKLGCIICGVSMLILAYFVRSLEQVQPGETNGLTFSGVVSVLMVYVFAFAFGVSLGPISWNVCSEIFPLRINAKCCAITTCTQWLFQIVIAGITPHLIASVGWVTYVIYAAFGLLTYVWVTFYVPETRGVALGKPMDDLFDLPTKASESDEAAVQEIEEVDEHTSLLNQQHERQRRRNSFAGYT